MKIVHFLHTAEHQSFYKLGLLFLMELARFYGGPAVLIVPCFLTKPDCRNVLPQHCNTIIKQQLCGEGLPLPLLQVDFFTRSRLYCNSFFTFDNNLQIIQVSDAREKNL